MHAVCQMLINMWSAGPGQMESLPMMRLHKDSLAARLAAQSSPISWVAYTFQMNFPPCLLLAFSLSQHIAP